MRGFYSTVTNIPLKLRRAIFSVAHSPAFTRKPTVFKTILRAPDVLSASELPIWRNLTVSCELLSHSQTRRIYELNEL